MTRRLCKEVTLFVKILETDTKVEGLFIAVQQFFKEKGVKLENISWASSKVTDYCVINRQLVAKNICEQN